MTTTPITPMYDHLVLISLDTLRSDALPFHPAPQWPAKYGLTRTVRAEALRHLADEGFFFSNCKSAAPYTSASHASLFTGKWPVRHGVFEFFNRRLRGGTLFGAARRHGFRTLFKVDFPIILGRHLGFDRDADLYIVEDDDAFLAALDPARRSVSFVHFGGIHLPYGFHNLRSGGDAYRAKVRDLEAGLPRHAPAAADRLVETYRDAEDLDLLVRYKNAVQHLYREEAYARIFDLYLEGIDLFLDRVFAPFLERLIDRLAGQRTLLVVFGDHGEEYDEESCGHFNTVADGVLTVPLILHGPDIARGHAARLVRTIDLAPTLAELLGFGGPFPAGMDGVSLAPTLLDRAPYAERPAFAQAYVADTAAYVSYQDRMLRRDRKSGSLPHTLTREVVIDGGCRLERWYDSVGAPYTKRLERYARDGAHSPCDAPEVAESLGEMLNAYNRMRRNGQAMSGVPAEVGARLAAMGYHV
ncbi:sulfatase-like hydrolase/transferase [Azospirillum sp. B506]|uniref:sulfatase-like hydrolase/transferase n=1 Tax=Azospirillum sp. B506 TaxID=137721 RepID=UPI00034DDFC3|nr:sulfatase-like hydrolase/transferase [Azospirillum sp. B506]